MVVIPARQRSGRASAKGRRTKYFVLSTQFAKYERAQRCLQFHRSHICHLMNRER